MDLNEKIAARRRELAAEDEKTKQAEKAREAEQQRYVRNEAIKQLSENGIELPDYKGIPLEKVDAEVEKLLDKAASDRMTSGENTTLIVLFVFGLLSFLITWWLGVFFIIGAFVYSSKTTNRYKEQIKAEGKVQLEQNQRNLEERLKNSSSF
ncbi:hypothetical protein [Pelobacter propionicus]|uniref:Uncharacterized protein n=1 Tax=Pelobacter propionicus (strain DSM 2379 / NBRC 103807 / OttBd1) TaxID=338966 RepID=A1AUX7_PELPD|nr:hypothetical protein [Pelobacter propionicus]ABL01148.1 hypothetical protein Ppro_3556 [Pelobacter propionicus DSM 2379]